tara:strand:+ start:88 stop:813 length:726 start_codon:yes stop_codon:yes gene_type:complete
MATKEMMARKRREKAQEQSKERRAKRISEGKSVIGGGLDGNKDTYGYIFNRPPKKKKAEAKAPTKKKVATKTNVSEGTAKVGGTKKKPNFTAMANPTKGKNPKGLSSADLEASIPKKSMPKSSGTAVSQNADKIVADEVGAGKSAQRKSNAAANADFFSPSNIGKKKQGSADRLAAAKTRADAMQSDSGSDSGSGAGVSGQEGMNAGARRRKERATPAFKHGGKVRGAGIAKKGVRKCKMR